MSDLSSCNQREDRLWTVPNFRLLCRLWDCVHGLSHGVAFSLGFLVAGHDPPKYKGAWPLPEHRAQRGQDDEDKDDTSTVQFSLCPRLLGSWCLHHGCRQASLQKARQTSCRQIPLHLVGAGLRCLSSPHSCVAAFDIRTEFQTNAGLHGSA